MSLVLFGHPFSSYTWKALIALYEAGAPFEFRNIAGDKYPENEAAFLAHWPVGKFPLLVEDGEPIMESSVIVEHVAPALVPNGGQAAREVRMLDRIFDNHVMTPVQAIVAEHLPFITPTPDEGRIARAKAALDKAYPWLDSRLAGREWAAGDSFTLADCAGAPSLFYADWVHPIPDQLATLKDYRKRVLARPSVARAVDEARPYRHLFPLGAPDRD
ncbi:MAG TPA: glutathione S-transferase family protein [Sphingomicrobium sp.]|nr:glutathione S-transferase family protein [Sphingomicrobium sp.]